MGRDGALLSGGVLVLALTGCQPHIGDQCVLSTDCSVSGDRQCDISQPGGYCTQFSCTTNSCPDNASCVVFEPTVPGCPYDDYSSPARTAESLCMKTCQGDGDCRGGYVCRDPRQLPWSALILDDNQTERVCIVPPDPGAPSANGSAEDAAVCQPTGPNVPPIDASTNVVKEEAGDDAASGDATTADSGSDR
jgi:hypothetical protein